jgi:predicted transposase/invertase (TIGR01784 family)
VSRQQKKGYINFINAKGEEDRKPWDYHLANIYGVFFMNFKDTDKKHQQGLSHFALMETTKHYQDTDVFQYWKIQMPIYRKMKESDCKNDIDKWIFNLSNMETMETTLPFTNDIPLFKQLGKIASYSNLSPEQQMQYDDSFNNYLAFMGQQEYKLKEGIKIGREEGRAEGRAEGARAKAIESARKMKTKGYSVDIIADITGLTPDEIAAL